MSLLSEPLFDTMLSDHADPDTTVEFADMFILHPTFSENENL